MPVMLRLYGMVVWGGCIGVTPVGAAPADLSLARSPEKSRLRLGRGGDGRASHFIERYRVA